MRRHQNLLSFFSGMLAAALLLACGTAALAVGGTVTFGTVSLSINGDTVLEKGQTLTTDAGATIPSTILYTDENGGGTTYVPLAALSRWLDIPVAWDGAERAVSLGQQPGTPSISVGTGEASSVWAEQPLHQVGAQAGPYTEQEPYWPQQTEMTSFFPETTLSSKLSVSDIFYPRAEDGYLSISVTNQSDCPLIWVVKSNSTITSERFPSTVVPAGQTVVRTFSAAEIPDYLYQTNLSMSLNVDPLHDSIDTVVRATVQAAHFQPN